MRIMIDETAAIAAGIRSDIYPPFDGRELQLQLQLQLRTAKLRAASL